MTGAKIVVSDLSFRICKAVTLACLPYRCKVVAVRRGVGALRQARLFIQGEGEQRSPRQVRRSTCIPLSMMAGMAMACQLITDTDEYSFATAGEVSPEAGVPGAPLDGVGPDDAMPNDAVPSDMRAYTPAPASDGGAGMCGAEPGTPLGASRVAHYSFTRGDAPAAIQYAVDPSAGLLLQEGLGVTLSPASVSTARGGLVELAADGSFKYAPPGGASFWGDDHFEYSLDDAVVSRRVRLTVHPKQIHLSDVESSSGNGFAMYGADDDDYAGQFVGGAGDVNGDGLGDVIVGAFRANALGEDNGRLGAAYVVFGKRDSTALALAELERGSSSSGFSIAAAPPVTIAGYGVDGAGDVNGDGLDDLIVSAFQPSSSDLTVVPGGGLCRLWQGGCRPRPTLRDRRWSRLGVCHQKQRRRARLGARRGAGGRRQRRWSGRPGVRVIWRG